METVFHSLISKNVSSIQKLKCVIQEYAWGKRGKQSLAARLKRSADDSFDLDEVAPYAELWMGTHPNGPAKILDSGLLLSEFLKANDSAVGLVPLGYPSNNLPFMLKVLSIQTALSIQTHPDKVFAKELNKRFPSIYKDPNHKPEMAIALTPFEGMCGFRLISEIKTNLLLYPELRAILNQDVQDQFSAVDLSDDSPDSVKKDALQKLLLSFMEAPDDLVNIQIHSLIKRITLTPLSPTPPTTPSPTPTSNTSPNTSPDTEGAASRNFDDEYVRDLMLRLVRDYPDDRGVLCPLLLNCLQLQPGESFFMGPNEPHAYVSGDIVECMALSDNTVRAGLTPKFKDVHALCQMLHYRCGKPSSLLIPTPLDSNTFLYRPPHDLCSEFEVERCIFAAHEKSLNSPPAVPCGSILLVYKGTISITSQSQSDIETVTFSEGSVAYIPANTAMNITAGDSECELFRAHVNLGH